MRSTKRSIVTEPPYFTRGDIDALGATPHLVRAPHVLAERDPEASGVPAERAAATPHVAALGEYRGELRRAIHAMKFRNARWIAVRFGRHLARAVGATFDVVTYAPTTNRRLRRRGHDQSALIASSVARTLRVRHVRALRRVDSRVQTGASRAQRMYGPRYVVRSRVVHGRTVLLVDDVLTTGSTLRHAREALLQAGAREVRCAVIAYVKAPPLSRVE
jgi:ComF family protein